MMSDLSHKIALTVGILITMSLGLDLYGDYEFLAKSVACGCWGYLVRPILY